MGLASALSTALTGLNAAETTIDVVGNNLANSNTVGFKASQAAFATQFLQTKSLGSAPSDGSGGTNPRQVGLGTMVAAVTPNFGQGTIQISSNPTDMAIQGDGFFIVQGTNNERLYTRNGIFKLNSQSQLTTITGNRVLGYGVDDQFQIQTNQLVPLSIPLGAASVAKPTANVFLEGTLSPTGDLANAAENIRTGTLTDGQYTYPTVVPTVEQAAAALPGTTLTPTSVAGTGSVGDGHYYYKIVYADANGTYQFPQENVVQATVDNSGAGENTVRFDNLLRRDGSSSVRIYRTEADLGPDTTYRLVSEKQMSFDLVGASGDGQISGGGAVDAGDYYYRFEYATGPSGAAGTIPGEVSRVESAVHVNVAEGENAVQLDNLPLNSDPSMTYLRVYRTKKGAAQDSTYYYVGEMDTSGLATVSYTDLHQDAAADSALSNFVSISDTTSDATMLTNNQQLDTTSMLEGQYKYYVTFYSTRTGRESIPNSVSTDITVSPGRIHLSDLPTPEANDPNQWDRIRIYRNLANDTNSFYRVTEISDMTSGTYTDYVSDATLLSNNQPLKREGPQIVESTKLRDVVQLDGSTYVHVFDYPEGETATLQFAGTKGGRTLATKSLTISDSTTVLDLMTFMEQSFGIQKRNDTLPNPIPIDANSGRAPGGFVQDGAITMVGNNGVANAIQVGLSSMKLVTSAGSSSINLPFASVASAKGESAVTDFIGYDSLGIPIACRLTAVLESRTANATTYRWFADSPDNDPAAGSEIAVGTGLISFDGEGNFISTTNNTVAVQRTHVPSASPLAFDLDFSQLSGLATDKSSLAVSRQDGSAPGVLSSFIVGEDGLIRGVFSNGITRDLGQVRLARFSNPVGLQQVGENMFTAGVNSGLPIEGNPNQQGIGSIVTGAQELSNTDIGGNLVELILASTMYRGNTRVVTTVQQMMDELLALRR